MAIEVIAENRWRRPTDTFSPLCDNALDLDTTGGLLDSPFRQNEQLSCRPDCQICITPIGQVLSNSCVNQLYPEETKSPTFICKLDDWSVDMDCLRQDAFFITAPRVGDLNECKRLEWSGESSTGTFSTPFTNGCASSLAYRCTRQWDFVLPGVFGQPAGSYREILDSHIIWSIWKEPFQQQTWRTAGIWMVHRITRTKLPPDFSSWTVGFQIFHKERIDIKPDFEEGDLLTINIPDDQPLFANPPPKSIIYCQGTRGFGCSLGTNGLWRWVKRGATIPDVYDCFLLPAWASIFIKNF